jgi:anti-anti-sigma regulatory factor
MSTNTSDTGNSMLINLPSSLRIGDVTAFKQQGDALLATAPAEPVLCDASAVEFIDAAALQLLAAMSQACAGQQRNFTIATPSAAFMSAATVSGYAALLGLAN